MSLEGLDRLVRAQAANVDALVRAAGGEAVVRLPVHVQGGSIVERKLLFVAACRRVPDDRRPVHACAQDVVSALVPFERENGSLVLAQGLFQFAARAPDASVAVVGARRQEGAGTVPVQRCHVLVARNLKIANAFIFVLKKDFMEFLLDPIRLSAKLRSFSRQKMQRWPSSLTTGCRFESSRYWRTFYQ